MGEDEKDDESNFLTIQLSISYVSTFAEFEIVQHAFNGIRVAVCVLVLNAVIKLWKGSVIDKVCLGIVLVTIAIGILTNISPVFIVISAAIVGLLVKGRKGERA